jgi:hypothetical protein
VVVPTQALVEYAGERVLERPGGVRRFLAEIGPQGWDRVGARVSDRPLEEALAEGLAGLVDASTDASARELAERMGGPDGALHPLRFVLTDPAGGLVGGYTAVVG